MVEAFISLGVAAATGFSVLIRGLHSRVHELDQRIDRFELRVAESYLSKAEFSDAIERVEQHMYRIENKLDKITTS